MLSENTCVVVSAKLSRSSFQQPLRTTTATPNPFPKQVQKVAGSTDTPWVFQENYCPGLGYGLSWTIILLKNKGSVQGWHQTQTSSTDRRKGGGGNQKKKKNTESPSKKRSPSKQVPREREKRMFNAPV